MDHLRLEQRDHEILRTLGRLHFLTSAEINRTFFTSEFAGFRRIRKLHRLNLVKRHTLGIPESLKYCAWRLTGAGVALVLDLFPDEPILGLDDRLSRQSLIDIEHREALSRLYLELVSANEHEEDRGASCAAIRKWIANVRTRADQLGWQADGEVVLAFRKVADEYRVIPDATVTTTHHPVRIFLELDRSNKTLERVAENLRRYASFLKAPYAETYPDRKQPWVVYVVKSDLRRRNIARVAERILGANCSWKVLVMDRDAVPWLASLLLAEKRELGSENATPMETETERLVTPLRAATNEFLVLMNTLLNDAPAVFDELSQMQPELMGQWKRALGMLYARAKEKDGG